VPDVRPLSVGECLRRAIYASVANQFKEPFRDHLWLQQVAVGVPSGLNLLIFSVMMLLELHPDWIVVKLDLRNAYNELKRAAVLSRMQAVDTVRDLVPLTFVSYGLASEIFIPHDGLKPAGYKSEEGEQQGDPLASARFCIGIHPEVKQLDSELQRCGGVARFDMDDGYVVGPADQVFPAILRFGARVHAIGLELQLGKCKCFSPATDLQNHPARPPTVQVGQCVLPEGPARGIMVGGMPVGEP